VLGWKEYELEVMRDHADKVVVVCSIENFDPMGVHTGDSITVAPAQTLTDVEYQRMRDAAFACIRRIGVDTGGSNIQFAVNPEDGEMVVIEMNPRVSRSSALASKATGFPIAKIAACLAVGYRLDEIRNDITKETPASFEPTIDYVVTKVPAGPSRSCRARRPCSAPRWQSGRRGDGDRSHLPESLQKALRSLETGRRGLNADPAEALLDPMADDELVRAAATPTARPHLPDRGRRAARACRSSASTTPPGSRPWFLDQLGLVSDARRELEQRTARVADRRDWRRAKAARLLRRAARAHVGRRRGRGAEHQARGRQRPSRSRPSTRARRVRGRHAVPLRRVRGRRRGHAGGPPVGGDPRQRTQPDRTRCRVRLLLRARRVRAVRRGLRDRDGQLQPRDRVDRLRHERPSSSSSRSPPRTCATCATCSPGSHPASKAWS
jgi:hypothetical protein